MRVWLWASLLGLSACVPRASLDLTQPAAGGTPTDSLILRSLQLSLAAELAADCPTVSLEDSAITVWEETILNAYAAELSLNPNQVPERFSAAFERLGQDAPRLLRAYREAHGLGAPPHAPMAACHVVAQERGAGSLIGRILE